MSVLRRRARRPARPGPGRCPRRLLRALDVDIGRRMEGLLAGDYRATLHGDGTGARAGPAVRAGRRRPADRLERHRPHRPAARPRSISPSGCSSPGSCSTPRPRCSSARPTGARPTWPRASRSRIGHVATRRGNRLGVVTFGDDRPARAAAAAGPAGRCSACSRRSAREPAEDRVGATSLGEALTPRRRARAPALAGRRRLRLPRPARLAPAAARARRPPRRARGRDPRPARAGAAERRRALARRPRDGPAAARRHAQRAAARALRRRGGRGARAGSRGRFARPGCATRAHDLGRLAALAGRLPRSEAAR